MACRCCRRQAVIAEAAVQTSEHEPWILQYRARMRTGARIERHFANGQVLRSIETVATGVLARKATAILRFGAEFLHGGFIGVEAILKNGELQVRGFAHASDVSLWISSSAFIEACWPSIGFECGCCGSEGDKIVIELKEQPKNHA